MSFVYACASRVCCDRVQYYAQLIQHNFLALMLQDSKYYAQFRLYCCEAYEILRKSSDLILSLFHLMAGASIEAIRNNPENAMLKLQVGCNLTARLALMLV